MSELELGLQQLYELYGHRLPEYQQFWFQLAGEEASHAAWIEVVKIKIQEGKVNFKENRFNHKSLETVIAYLKTKIDQAHDQKLTPFEALAVARDFENSIFERALPEALDSKSLEYKKLISNLIQATKIHHNKIVAELSRLKNLESSHNIK